METIIQSADKEKLFVQAIIKGDNHPPKGSCSFESSDHIRYQNGEDVSGHNYNCHRRIVIEKNIRGNDGYTITTYNLDGIHPMWRDNIQMTPKPMKIIKIADNEITFRGYGHDAVAMALGAPSELASFSRYGITVRFKDDEIERVVLHIYDRRVDIIYFK